jgi:hypothetical protein
MLPPYVKMGTVCFSATLVPVYELTQNHIQKELSRNTENLRSELQKYRSLPVSLFLRLGIAYPMTTTRCCSFCSCETPPLPWLPLLEVVDSVPSEGSLSRPPAPGIPLRPACSTRNTTLLRRLTKRSTDAAGGDSLTLLWKHIALTTDMYGRKSSRYLTYIFVHGRGVWISEDQPISHSFDYIHTHTHTHTQKSQFDVRAFPSAHRGRSYIPYMIAGVNRQKA